MKPTFVLATACAVFASLPVSVQAVDPARSANTVILTEAEDQTLGIETEEAEESDFEEAVFAVGRIEEIPERHAVLSSRISGRAVEISGREGDLVKKGDTLVRVESRQPGDPPPVIALTAPIDGLVVESHVRLGEPVEPDKELLDISDLREVWAIARVPEHQAGNMKPGSKARIKVAALGNEPLQGELLRFGTAADRESGTIDAIFRVPNESLRMRPGMRAEFEIVVAQREGVLTVPRAAVQGGPAGRHVFTKDFDVPHAYLKTPVKTGQISGDRIEIISGLFAGDAVVTTGSYPLGFAGGGSGPSLKEALDAAHGHEHNEDGSELTAAQKAAKTGGSAEHHHEEEGGKAAPAWRERFFMAATAVLATLLVIVSVRGGRSKAAAGEEA